jgi:hypothetical protein
MSFLRNSKHKNVIKIGIAYLAFAWFLVQVIATLTPYFNWPWILVRGFSFMLIGGYPLVMLMAWAYEATHRTKGWEEENRIANEEIGKGWKFPVFIGCLVGMSIFIFLIDIFILRAEITSAADSQDEGSNVEQLFVEKNRFVVING